MLGKAKKWRFPENRQDIVDEICRSLNILPPVARVLVNRGIGSPEEAQKFLNPSLNSLHSPWSMKDISRAVERISNALKSGEKIIVYGDYDVDGITSSVLLTSALRSFGGHVEYFLPSRFDEGYGLQKEAIEQFYEQGYNLLITVDCGINSKEEVSLAREMGIDVIVTDHHYPLLKLEEATAVINPLQEECYYPWKSLAGVGVAFKLICALADKMEHPLDAFQYIDLVALGTVADIVPLRDENRVLTVFGLEKINQNPHPALKIFMEVLGVKDKELTAGDLAFIIAPSINAAGRMGKADPAAAMFMEADGGKIRELGEFLATENQNRRQLESSIYAEAKEMIGDLYDNDPQDIIVLGKEGWHYGVIGIVASRLVDDYYCPVLLVALEGSEGKGSARSIPGFNITEALSECGDLLDKFGGHEQAAGFSIKAENLGYLRERLANLTREKLTQEEKVKQLKVDCELEGNEIDLELARQLEKLSPFGMGNEYPRFCSREWEIQNWKLVGKEQKHLKLNLKKENNNLQPILFSGNGYKDKIKQGRKLDLAFIVKNGIWQERPILNVEIKDMAYSDNFIYMGWELIDRRGVNKLSYVQELLNSENELIIYTGGLKQQEDILRRLPESSKDKIGFVSPRLKELESIEEGKINNLVFFHLPLKPEIVHNIVNTMKTKNSLKIHLIYHEKDREFNRQVMDASLPTSYHVLERFWEAMKGKAGNNNFFATEHLKVLTSKPMFTEAMRKRCLQIFEELGLIQPVEGGWFLVVQDSDINLSTIDLESSPTYCECVELKDECQSFEEFLLGSDLKAISEHFLMDK